jgi:hypothetical protein
MPALKQFIIYRAVPKAAGKTEKLPLDWRTGQVANAHDPSIWMDEEFAHSTAMLWGADYGVGFVFTPNDPYFFLDIDNCMMPDGTWSPIALRLCQMLAGCYMEVSRSGRGIHIFGSGKPPIHGCRNDAMGLEFYESGRFVALTGINAQGSWDADASAILPSLVSYYFPPDASQGTTAAWATEPDPEWYGPADDAELIRRAMQSHSVAAAFGNRASFADLWLADEKALAGAYPDQSGRPYDCSAADAALAQHLAFWTGKDCERIRRLMPASRLARDKWEREDYLPRTILGAVARQVDVLKDKRPSPPLAGSPVGPQAPASAAIEGNRLLSIAEQMILFANTVYIADSHRVLVPGGQVLKPEQFRVHFGGYSFMMDHNNERISRDPWEAYSQSQLIQYPKVNGTCFRPDLPAAYIVERNGQTFVNIYVSIEVARKVGDPAPFVDHLAKVLPDQRDRDILLSYMAACVQHKGIKFQWAPLLQGVEGNGKTLFTRCVAEAIGRRYVHWPKASKLSKEFNAWMLNKLFFAVEDIYVPDARREVIEELKPMITGGDGLEIEAKGVDQTSADICGNFIFNSNHKDGIKKTANDRRFCLLFSAQQNVEDLARDGMQGDYFPNLYRWLRGDGYAIVSEFLHTYQIPIAYNPAGECQRAPETTTTAEAILNSTGSIEQEILEAVAQGLPGFNGGWISSIYLDKLIEGMRLRGKITHNRRKEMLENLGYRWHPALSDGRVNNTVIPDGGKPRLYIKTDSLALQITDPHAVAKAYEAANTNRPTPAASMPFMAHHGRA